MDDCKYILDAASKAIVERGYAHLPENVQDYLSDEFLLDLTERYGDDLPSIDAMIQNVAKKSEEMQKAVDHLRRLKEDRFEALRWAKGDKLADTFLGVAKQMCHNYSLEYRRGVKHAGDDKVERITKSGHSQERYIDRRLTEVLIKACNEEVSKILFAPSIRSLLGTVTEFYLSKDDLKKMGFSDFPSYSPLAARKTRYSNEGKIMVDEILPDDISERPGWSFAPGVAALETGVAAQQKNPRPREGNSPPKRPLADPGAQPS